MHKWEIQYEIIVGSERYPRTVVVYGANSEKAMKAWETLKNKAKEDEEYEFGTIRMLR